MAAKIIKLYKPKADGKWLHNVHIVHKLEVQKALIKKWVDVYGADYIEVLEKWA